MPVVAAPMAGGPSTPRLAAAVSEAGGLGFLAAGYKAPDDVAAEFAAARTATSAPLGINLFVVEPNHLDPAMIRDYRASLGNDATKLGVRLGEPTWDDDHWAAKLDLVHDVRPDVVSFTFGCPAEEVLSRLTRAGVHCAVTVTTPVEAQVAEARGATSLCVQGPEAGGHRGTWDPEAVPDQRPLLDLIDAVVDCVHIPVVAAGGLMEASDVSEILRHGGLAAQAGTAYLAADEAGTNSLLRAALTDGTFVRTDVTRAYTGRWARGLANRFMEDHREAPSGYPQIHHVTAPLRAAAVQQHDAQIAHLWAGTGHALARTASASEITLELAP